MTAEISVFLKNLKFFSIFLIVTGYSAFVFHIEQGFPVRKFVYDLAVFYTLYGILLLVTRRNLFSWFVSLCALMIFFLLSNRKLELMNAYLIKDDVIFALKNPLFTLDFISIGIAVFLVVFFIFGVLILWFEQKDLKVITFPRVGLFLCMLIISIWMPGQKEFVYHIDRPAKTRALLQFVASFRNDYGLIIPAPPSNAQHSCCAQANLADLSLTRVGGARDKNIIVILMESTFDLGTLGLKDHQSNFFKLPFFPLKTYVVGGGTWVEEFAFLHGVPPSLYGENYKAINTLGMGRLAGRIAPALGDAGYELKTFSISDRGFYGGEKMHKSLGIESYYSSEDRVNKSNGDLGSADEAILNDVLQNVRESRAPSFIFVTTEINHSPHDKKYLNVKPTENYSENQISIIKEYYEREAKFYENMFNFIDGLNGLTRDSIVIFFGDHIPAAIYENFSSKDFKRGQYSTIGLMYSTQKKDFLKIEKVLGCYPEGLQISDLDVIAMHAADFKSIYIEEKLKAITESCL